VKEKLDETFYRNADVTRVARSLLGKLLCTRIGGKKTSGIIVETEAYSHTERGCHAYGNRMTARNEVMFSEGGHAYVYLCYGIHYLFNVVTNKHGVGDAVLIRALQPVEGVDVMMKRMRVTQPVRITSGPGKLSKAMGIDRRINGKWLAGNEVWIERHGKKMPPGSIVAGVRIGIDYAGADAALPWRFTIKDNPWISR
jgi:DNA-3-methyladenine glycosylase